MATILELLPDVAVNARGVPRRILVQAFRRAVREFCRRTRWSTRTLPVIATVVDTVQYTLLLDPADDQVEVIGVRWARINTGGKWERLTERFVDAVRLNDGSSEPDGYEYRPHGLIALDPPPNGIWNVTVKAIVQPIRGATSIDDNLLVDWEDGLKAGTLYHLYRMPGVAWTNPAESSVQHDLFMRAVHSAKSDVARNYNAGGNVNGDTLGRPNAGIRQKILPI